MPICEGIQLFIIGLLGMAILRRSLAQARKEIFFAASLFVHCRFGKLVILGVPAYLRMAAQPPDKIGRAAALAEERFAHGLVV